MTSLNPVHSIGTQLVEAIQLHRDVSKRWRRRARSELLKAVGIPRAERRMDDYPHQFSGGMRQRAMIAMALVNDPDLLIADEPTTALDVTTQAQIMTLMKRLQEDFGSAIIVITHDLGVVAETADDVLVMYAAEVAEQAPVEKLFNRPHHPYTWGLLGSLPRLDTDVERLVQIPGQPPSLLQPPKRLPVPPALPLRHGEVPPGRSPSWSPSRPTLSTCRRAISTRRPRTERPRNCSSRRWGRHSKPRADPMAEDLLVVDDVKKHFPVTRGIIFQKQVGAVKAVDGVSFSRQVGRDARDRRGIRLRQVDARPLHHAAARPDRRQDHLRRPRHHEASRARPCGRSGAR